MRYIPNTVLRCDEASRHIWRILLLMTVISLLLYLLQLQKLVPVYEINVLVKYVVLWTKCVHCTQQQKE